MVDEMLVGILAAGAIVGAVILEGVTRPSFEEEQIRDDVSDCVLSLKTDVLPGEAFEACNRWYRWDRGRASKE